MNTHPESEQLSAFVDGELTQREQVALEAHVASCPECTGLLAALRATVSDLASLEQPEIDEQTTWAIRKAVSRERRRGSRSRRWAWAAVPAAASVIGLLAVVLVAKNGSDGAAGVSEALFGLPKVADYNERTAEAELNAFVAGEGIADRTAARPETQAGEPLSGDAAKRSGAQGGFAYSTAEGDQTADAARCEQSVRTPGEEIRLVHVIAGTYKRTPALLMFFEAPADKPERIELWVVRRDSCEVLLFRQKKL